MGIDHVVDLDCAAKRALGTQGIVDLVKARARADAVIEISRKNGDTRPPEQITFTIAVMTPGGVREQEARVSELLAQTRGLDPHRAACASCPAAAGNAFGCYRTVNYPIPAHVERWLLERLPARAGSTAGQFLRRALADFGWDGAHAAGMRRSGDRFFQARAPEVRRFEDGFAVSADQVHHMLFNVGHPNPTHCTMLALFFGVLPHELDPGALRGAARAQALAQAALPAQADGPIESMAQYLRACVTAARLDVSVLVDG